MSYTEEQASVAESELIGLLMLTPKSTLVKVRDIIVPNDFSHELPQAIYLAACQLDDEGIGENLDVSAIIARTKRNGVEVPGEWAMQTMQIAPPVSNIEIVAKVIKDTAIEREAQQVGMKLASGEITALETKDKLEKIIGGKRSAILEPVMAATSFFNYFNKIRSGKASPFIPTGFQYLDETLGGGFVTSGMITLAARPAIGKTAVALAFADNVAKSGKKVLYESLEMSVEQIWARRIARESGVFTSKIMNGRLDERNNDLQRVTSAIGTLSSRPLYVEDKSSTISKIERDINTIGDLGLIVIDHIGLITPENAKESRYEAMTKATHRLKQIAIQTGIPILALCQLNRSGVGSETTLPTMSSLRDSGSVEEDSDVVMLLHRPDYYKPKEQQAKYSDAQEMSIIVDKNRHGATGKVDMKINLATMKLWEEVNYRDVKR